MTISVLTTTKGAGVRIPKDKALMIHLPTDKQCCIFLTVSEKGSFLPYQHVLETQGGFLLICCAKGDKGGLVFSRDFDDKKKRDYATVNPGTAWVDSVTNVNGDYLQARYELIDRPDKEEYFEEALSTFEEKLETSGSVPTVTLSDYS